MSGWNSRLSLQIIVTWQKTNEENILWGIALSGLLMDGLYLFMGNSMYIPDFEKNYITPHLCLKAGVIYGTFSLFQKEARIPTRLGPIPVLFL
jgi:hypothetical protein